MKRGGILRTPNYLPMRRRLSRLTRCGADCKHSQRHGANYRCQHQQDRNRAQNPHGTIPLDRSRVTPYRQAALSVFRKMTCASLDRNLLIERSRSSEAASIPLAARSFRARSPKPTQRDVMRRHPFSRLAACRLAASKEQQITVRRA